MEPDRESGWDDETRAAIDAFRGAIRGSAPPGGRERVGEAIAAEWRRERIRGAGWLLRVAAVLVLGSGALLYWRSAANARDAVVCPHGTLSGEKTGALPETLRAFLENPDNFQRVCQCQPRYSGNLRREPEPFAH